MKLGRPAKPAPLAAPSRPGFFAGLNPTVRLLRTTAAEAQRSRLPQMAAALSYRTVFGLIPVMVVALVAMKLFFTTDDQITDVLNQVLRYSGLSSIATPTAEMGPFPEGAEVPAASAEAAANLDAWIKNIVVRASTVNFKAIGLIGVAALLYAAISMLVEVERAFNQIFRVPAGRSWLRRFVNYWALLCWGGVGLLLSFMVTNWFSGELLKAAAMAGADPGSAALLATAGYLSAALVSTALFLLIYMVVPNTRVRLGPALIGAMTAAVLWEAGKWGFTQYLHYTSGYARLYGSIALIPIFLLWVYLTWIIVLAGLNIAYYLQHGRHQTVPQPTELATPAIIDPASTLAVMAAMARRFEAGEPSNAAGLGTLLGIPEPIIAQMLDRLAEAGLVHRVRVGEKDGHFVLSRPPERIPAAEVLKIGEELLGPAGDSGNPVVIALQAARAALVRERSVASFLETSLLTAHAMAAAPAPVVAVPARPAAPPPIPVAPPDNGPPPVRPAKPPPPSAATLRP